MHGIWIYAVCVFVMINSLYGDTGSNPAPSCPIKCDLVQEVHNLRQLFNQDTNSLRQLVNQETSALRQIVNQETNLRMGLDTQVQDLRKTVTDILAELQMAAKQLNTSIEATDETVQKMIKDAEVRHKETEKLLQGLRNDLDNRYTSLTSSVQRTEGTVNGVQNEVKENTRTMATLETKLISLNQTYWTQGTQHKILFSAKLVIYGARVKNGVVQYNNIITNIGGAYSSTECTFTSPVDGDFVFTWSTCQNANYAYTAMVKNGSPVLYQAAGDSGLHGYETASQTVTMQLVKGDRVWIKHVGGSKPYTDTRYTSVFTGFLN